MLQMNTAFAWSCRHHTPVLLGGCIVAINHVNLRFAIFLKPAQEVQKGIYLVHNDLNKDLNQSLDCFDRNILQFHLITACSFSK